MSVAAESVLEQALALTVAERAKVASELLASLDGDEFDEDEVDRLWSIETQRRTAMLEAGEARTFSRDEVRDGLDALRAQRSA